MQRLDPPIHHFGKAGVLRDVDDRHSLLNQKAARAAGRDDFEAETSETFDEGGEFGFVADADERPTRKRRGHETAAEDRGWGENCLRRLSQNRSAISTD